MNIAGRLSRKIAIVTGAARGQGAATAKLFAAEGARVVVADVLKDEGVATATEIGANAFFHELDISDEAGWQTLIRRVTQEWGTPDILINNAGILHQADILSLTQTDFERVIRINLIGAWLGIKTVAPGMITKATGAIVNICSTSALCGMNGLAAYSASKWALRGLTKTAAMELGHRGVRVNAVFPGAVNTTMSQAPVDAPRSAPRRFNDRPIQRMGEPEEISSATLFLASDDASYLCGAEIVVDGGMTLGTYKEFLPGAPN